MAAFDTSIRDRALKRKREQLEQERRKLIYIVAETLRKNREKYDIHEAYITGSLLQHYRWYPFSDIDVIVSGCSKHLYSIMRDLEDATDKDVDVIDLGNHPSPDWLRKKGLMIYG